MSQPRLLLRCYARAVEGQWQAFCLDFDLAAQADTYEEARAKLASMISAYLYDALRGGDRDHAEQLLHRRAPWTIWLRFYSYLLQDKVLHVGSRLHHLFREPVPLVPASCCQA